MRAALGLVLIATLLAGCGRPTTFVKTLIFLTREGCAVSDQLRTNLDAALRTLKTPVSYQVIDQATLASTDPRAAYPTPTLLYAGRDLFGLAEPVPPFPEPT